MFPWIRDKSKWPKPPDLMCFKDWPCGNPRFCSAVFAPGEPEYIAAWKKLPANSTVEEVIRNVFIRQPVLLVSIRRV